jgi:hypothetical protein
MTLKEISPRSYSLSANMWRERMKRELMMKRAARKSEFSKILRICYSYGLSGTYSTKYEAIKKASFDTMTRI